MDIIATNWLDQASSLVLVALAMVLGGLIGLEREIADRPAGFRTHMLVAGAAALFVGLADPLLSAFSVDVHGENLRSDPIRIVEAIVTGVAFLGAGTIFRRREGVVEGLTTAASLLMASAVGAAMALQQLLMAGGVTLLTLLVLRGLRGFDDRLPEPDREGRASDS